MHGIAETAPTRDRDMLRLLAFCGRHGHQQIDVLERMETVELIAYSEQLGWLIEQEAAAYKSRT